jgi:pimeloyl-ACP methyl ester carboxylesterase
MLRLLALLIMIVTAAAPASARPARPGFTSDRISVEVTGSGPDVVLIPGLSSSPQVWAGTVAAVPGYRYHLVHVAGFASKAAGANATGPVVAPVAEEIARYIRVRKLKRPALVGHSLGGSWAMMVAARHPELASKVMVVDMMPFMGAMFGGPAATPQSVEGVAGQIRQGIASSAGEQRRQIISQTIATMVKTESLRAAPIEQSLASSPSVSGQAMYDLITTDLRPELSRIRVPLTVLWVIPPNAPIGEAQLAGFYKMSFANTPQAVLKRIPDSYHFIMLDQPTAFQRELREFLGSR